jgi:two-component system sensor histidine kinase HupT/HoxJ
MHNIFFVLLHISIVLILMICIYLLQIKSKKQIHIVFIWSMIAMLVWSTGYLLEKYTRDYFGQTIMIYVYIWYTGLCFIPPCLLLLSIVFVNTKIRFTKKYLLLFIIPVLSIIMLLTNEHHHLFFVWFSGTNDEVVFGKYFIIHSIYSYACIILGLARLFYHSVKISRFFSKQSVLIAIGSLIPLFVNIIVTFKLMVLPAYTTAIAFSATMIFISIAILRYQFLRISPIALRTIVDRISDSFIVVNDEFIVIDYNRTIKTAFRDIADIQVKKSIFEIFEGTCLINDNNNLYDLIKISKESHMSISFEKHITGGQVDLYFNIEITPIIVNENYLGTIVLFKDITENIRHLEAIEEKHAIMMEQERLASLGQLMGGIAHNLKTSIMSIAGAVEGLRDLVDEYEMSIGDSSVTIEDHHEIASEMRTWLTKIKPYCSYMTDIIDTVKGQTVHPSATLVVGFTINELLKRIELLLKYELMRNKCTLNIENRVNTSTELNGDINSLIQVFDNIIINAIQAYEGKEGRIDFIIEEKDNNILFTVKDYAKGIPDNIKDKLLKEMITTKGRAGTGLGLYMSNLTIKGRFGGNMWLTSEEGKGSSFFIQIPLRKQLN